MDEEKVVRRAVIEELKDMISGKGIYRSQGRAFTPALRFVALVCLCVDGDRVSGHSRANGNAANVGKSDTEGAGMAARRCVVLLRRLCGFQTENCATQLMPEYIVPYAFYLLAHRRETPSQDLVMLAKSPINRKSSGARTSDQLSDEASVSQHRVLKRRLKMLFEPLVKTLGDGADNISFLLQMTSILASCVPVNIDSQQRSRLSSVTSPGGQSLGSRSSRGSQGTPNSNKSIGTSSAAAKLKIVCAVARVVLLSFVKKDVNLAEHPGDTVKIPEFLFEKPRKELMKSSRNVAAEEGSHRAGEGGSEGNRVNRSSERTPGVQKARLHDRVHFSPELVGRSLKTSPALSDLSPGLSPILKSHTPEKRRRTLGALQKTPSSNSSRPHSEANSEEVKTLSPGVMEPDTPLQNTSVASSRRHSDANGEEVKTLSPGGTDAETPVTKASSKVSVGNRRRQMEQPQLSGETAPGDEAENSVASEASSGTQEEEEKTKKDAKLKTQKRETKQPAKKKPKTGQVPIQISINRGATGRNKTEKLGASFSFGDDEGERVKPLGNSNRATSRGGGKRHSKQSVQSSPKRTRRSARSDA